MSFESQRGLFILVSRKRERSPSSGREESLLLAPSTPPAMEGRRMFDEEEDWDVTTQEWSHTYVSEIQESYKKSRIRPWSTDNDALLLAYQDPDTTSDFLEDSPSPLPFAMPTFNLSAEESYNVGTQPRTESYLSSLSSWEDIEDIANAASVTSSPIASRSIDDKPVVVQHAPTIENLQPGQPEDEESSNLPGYSEHHSSGLSDQEKCLRSSA